MGSLVVNQLVSDIGHHPHHQHHIMVGGGSRRDEASGTSARGSVDRRTSSASVTYNASIPATPTSPTIQPRNVQSASDRSSSTSTPVAASQPRIQEPASMQNISGNDGYPQTSYGSQHLNQHSRGFDQSGFPLSSDPRGLSSSPSSPRLQPTYRSTRSLGGSEATSPSRIKVRDLSHIQSFASEELLTPPRLTHRPGSAYSETGRQYEISSMPVADIIEMVAGLLTKITTTNDQQHEHVHRPVPPPEEAANMSPQQSCVLAFHGKNVPSITILSYLSRIHKYCPTTYEVFLSLLVYFDRMTEMVNRGFLHNMRQQASERSTTAGGPQAPHSPMPMNIDSPAMHADQPSVSTPPSGSMELKDGEIQSATSLPPSPVQPLGQGDLSQFFVVDSYNIHRLVIAGVTCASKFFSDVFYTNSRYAKVNQIRSLDLKLTLTCPLGWRPSTG
jgi:PHO85 cyclin-6/7